MGFPLVQVNAGHRPLNEIVSREVKIQPQEVKTQHLEMIDSTKSIDTGSGPSRQLIFPLKAEEVGESLWNLAHGKPVSQTEKIRGGALLEELDTKIRGGFKVYPESTLSLEEVSQIQDNVYRLQVDQSGHMISIHGNPVIKRYVVYLDTTPGQPGGEMYIAKPETIELPISSAPW